MEEIRKKKEGVMGGLEGTIGGEIGRVEGMIERVIIMDNYEGKMKER